MRLAVASDARSRATVCPRAAEEVLVSLAVGLVVRFVNCDCAACDDGVLVFGLTADGSAAWPLLDRRFKMPTGTFIKAASSQPSLVSSSPGRSRYDCIMTG